MYIAPLLTIVSMLLLPDLLIDIFNQLLHLVPSALHSSTHHSREGKGSRRVGVGAVHIEESIVSNLELSI